MNNTQKSKTPDELIAEYQETIIGLCNSHGKKNELMAKQQDLVGHFQERCHALERLLIERANIKWWQFGKIIKSQADLIEAVLELHDHGKVATQLFEDITKIIKEYNGTHTEPREADLVGNQVPDSELPGRPAVDNA